MSTVIVTTRMRKMMAQTINIPEPDIVLERIKQAIENNQWSLRELNNLIGELVEFEGNF